jgi:dCMP deaminase
MNKWDYRFLRLAREVSTYSKDPSTQVGCVLVSPDRKRVIIGYNGFPEQMEDKPEWLSNREEKYSRIIHGEINAKNNAMCDISGFTQYTWPLCSCDRCMVQMAGAGIARFVAPKMSIENESRWGAAIEKSKSYARDMKLVFDELEFPTTYSIEFKP